MGYLSQRKKEQREDFLLKLILGTVFLLFTLSFFGNGEGVFYCLESFRFHFYLISLVAFFYCLIKRFWLYAVLSFLLTATCFMSLGYSSRIFFNDSKENFGSRSIFYAIDTKLKNNDKLENLRSYRQADFVSVNNFILSMTDEASKEGIVHFSPNHKGYFVDVNIEGSDVVLISIDFAGIKNGEIKTAFDSLTKFIELQENPVVVFGDFGIASWTTPFINFIHRTKLEVKNRVIMSNGNFRFNPFIIPSINLLGPKSLGLEKVHLAPKSGNPKHPIYFKITF